MITRRGFLAGLAAAPFAPRVFASQPMTVQTPRRFTVLSLFRPQRLVLHADAGSLDLRLDELPFVLRRGTKLVIVATGGGVAVSDVRCNALGMTSAAAFSMEVPGKLRRRYVGTLSVAAVSGVLRCVVGIERELAVASIVAAESPPHSGANALAAQAIAARSFLGGAAAAHAGADFCDTTHCQFLRDPPPEDSVFAAAARSTDGLALRFRDPVDDQVGTLAAMYSRSCGGRTRTLAELGLPARGYPYYAVDCTFCQAHPERWERALDVPIPRGERARLDYNRIHGWSALPGHVDSVAVSGVAGRGVGHGVGLCQLGAADMAARGASFADILAHYYPNTTLAHVS